MGDASIAMLILALQIMLLSLLIYALSPIICQYLQNRHAREMSNLERKHQEEDQFNEFHVARKLMDMHRAKAEKHGTPVPKEVLAYVEYCILQSMVRSTKNLN
ncbi:hypothetical protein LTR17_007528 [Elasticomyces elasticus]|nr:hypothetical protein LTR17_007528 [Elasticomyces elasticus]